MVGWAIGCSASTARTDRRPPPPERWSRSALWLHATAKTSVGHAAECRHARAVLAAEGGCKGALCGFGAELAAEWQEKCSTLLPGEVAAVKASATTLAERALASPGTCARHHTRFMEHGCDPRHCRDDAQEWATRCGEREGSPLALTLLERVVSRHLADPEREVTLDPRSCETLRGAVEAGASCVTESACKRAWQEVETERERCGDEHEKLPLAAAVRTLAIAVGAVRDPDAIPLAPEPPVLEKGAVPLMLADGGGAVLMVCTRRVVTLEAYISRREACEGSFVHVARAVGEGPNRELRRGNLRIRRDVEVVDVFPALAVVGEDAALAQRRASALDARVAAAIALGGSEGLVELVAALDEHARWLQRSALMRQALAPRDEALVPLFETAARAKAALGKSDVRTRRGVAARARTRPFADLTGHGALDPSDDTEARWLIAEAVWPQATAAYATLLGPVIAAAERTDTPALRAAWTQEARAAGVRCNARESALHAIGGELLACVFDGCDDGRMDELYAARGVAFDGLRSDRRAFDRAVTAVDPALAASLAETTGCVLPGLQGP